MHLLSWLLLPLLAAPALPEPKKSPRLEAAVREGLDEAVKKLASEKWSKDVIAVTLIDLKDPEKPEIGEHRGDAPYYPASTVKMLYMGATYQWVKDGRVKIDAAYQKDLELMIGPSDNLATQRVVDRLAGTQDGPALEGKAYAEFADKRNAVNRWLQGLGLKSLNACQKTYNGDEISPRDYQFLRGGKSSGPFTNRNRMTSHDAARFLMAIATDKLVDAASCDKMRALMARKLPDHEKWILGGAPAGSKAWSKPGWVATERHDAAIVELPGGRKLVLAIFTQGRSYEGTLIPEIAKSVLARLDR